MATKKTKAPSKAPKKNKAPKAQPMKDTTMQVDCWSSHRPSGWKFQRKTADGYEAGYVSSTEGTQSDVIAGLRACAAILEKETKFRRSLAASNRETYVPVVVDSDDNVYLHTGSGYFRLSFGVDAVQWRQGSYVPKSPHAA